MPAITAETLALRWSAIADMAAHAPDRLPIVQDVAAKYVPAFGDLSSRDAGKLTRTVEDAIEGTFAVPMHSTSPGYIPGMLTDGFQWPRWREAGTEFEPYEDKLAEWNALGAGERSEDFLFTEVRLLPEDRSLRAALYRSSLAGRMGRTDGHARGSGTASSTGYGHSTLAFDPRTLVNATMLPAVENGPWYGTKAATIEHLPALLASRLAGEHGFMADTAASGAELAGYPEYAKQILRDAPGEMRALRALLRAGHDERVAAVRELTVADGARRFRNPLEAHVRGLTPQSVARVDNEPPTLVTGLRDGRDGQFLMNFHEPFPTPPHTWQSGRHVEIFAVSDIVHPSTVRELRRAAEALGVPVGGLAQQQAAKAQALEAIEHFGPVERVFFADASKPDGKVYATDPRLQPGVNYVEDWRPLTAPGTAALRQRMAAAREARDGA